MANYLIIGGSSGIGHALVKILAAENHQVYATFNTGEFLEKITGVNYFHHEVKNIIPEENLPETLDGFVYCPGAIDLKPFSRNTPQSFLDDYELQVVGAVRSLQAARANLLKSNNPSVLFFSTVAVQSGFSYHTKVSASKGALEGLTKALAAEYATKMRVNAIAPSLTDTPLAERILNSEEKKMANANRNPMKKLGEAHDIAHLAAFLLSDKSSWITGQIIHVDGGMSTLLV